MDTTRSAVYHAAGEMQMEQELPGKLMYMQQLAPFLISIEQFGEVTQTMQLFRDHSRGMSYIWVGYVEQLPLDYQCHEYSS